MNVSSDKKISIITCTYNSGKYLAECLNSVREQTHDNIEHIFVDGFSNDDTLDIIKKYYPVPIIYQQKANGIYPALNLGLEKTTGDIVGILHSDDTFADPHCLERIIEAFMADPEISYYSSVMEIYDSGLKHRFAALGAKPHKMNWREKLYSTTYYAHPTYYFRREFLNRIGEYDTKYKIAADIDWLIRLEKLNLKNYFDSKPLLKFRSTGYSTKRDIKALCEEMKIYKNNGDLDFGLILIYIFHFFRRSIRNLLQKLKLGPVIKICRHLLYKFRLFYE